MKLLCRASGWAILVAVWLALGAALQGFAEEKATEEIDWNRARELYQRSRRGEALTAEENAYLERAKAAKGREGRPKGPAPQAKPSTGLAPLDQMTAQDRYKGEDGGLYGGGRNTPPDEHLKAALAEAAKIRPLDPQGKPAPDGRIVLLSIGMSNTTQEFSKFKELADKDPAKSPLLAIVDGAQGGQDAARWSTNDMPAWRVAEDRLRAAAVTPQQVQAVWMKHARIGPARYGEFPKHADELKGHILASLNIARERYPNLLLAFLSSRIYAGYAATPLNPEPYAYESAFAVRGLIQDQMRGDAKLNWDAAKGPVKAPLLLWGPYLWGDGVTPRKSDGSVWQREDLGGDGTHPSPSGREKVARLLLGLLKSDPCAKGWFLRPGN
ncbi:MAG: hypothetical protein FJ291_22060 [Planctomycetes bacterium]|nr:hypothetical protein [Planctomycetota bacterium]